MDVRKLVRYFWFDLLLLFVVCLLDTNLLQNKYPHFSSAYDGTSKQVLVPKRGKKKYQHFLYPVNHLNQRKSPSAPLVSQEIETDFFVVVFPERSRFSRKVADVTIVRGIGGWRLRKLCS